MTVAKQYDEARRLAIEIVKTYAAPRFYADLNHDRMISQTMFYSNPIIEKARHIVTERDEHFGHGLRHSEKVAADAGTIVHRESVLKGASSARTDRAVLIVHLASVLHDIRRRVPDHARQSALAAAEILSDFALEDAERDWIVGAIRNHEAFIEPTPMGCPEAQLISDALYDADKFRWGPDNFTETIWEMISPDKFPLSVLLAHFPKGMEGIKRITATFRSETGAKYGPEFIEIGMMIGQKLYNELLRKFPGDSN